MPSPLKASPFTFGKQPPNGYYICTAYFGIEVTCFFTLISILWNGSTALGIPCPEVLSSLSPQVTKSGCSKNSVRINHEAVLEELTVSVLKKLDSISDNEFESFTAAKQKSGFLFGYRAIPSLKSSTGFSTRRLFAAAFHSEYIAS